MLICDWEAHTMHVTPLIVQMQFTSIKEKKIKGWNMSRALQIPALSRRNFVRNPKSSHGMQMSLLLLFALLMQLIFAWCVYHGDSIAS